MASQILLQAALALVVAVSLFSSARAYCPAPWTDAQNNTYYTAPFAGGADSYQTCLDLVGGAHFMYNITDKLLISHYENYPEEPYGWIAWGQSFSGKMAPSNVLLAFGAPENPDGYVNVSAWHLPSRNPSAFHVIPGAEMNITEGSIVESRNNGTLMAIRSKIRLANPTASINMISAKGPGYNFTGNRLMKHYSTPQVLGINLATEAVVAVAPTQFNPFSGLGLAPARGPATAPARGPSAFAPRAAAGPGSATSPIGARAPKAAQTLNSPPSGTTPTLPMSQESQPAPKSAVRVTLASSISAMLAMAAASVLL